MIVSLEDFQNSSVVVMIDVLKFLGLEYKIDVMNFVDKYVAKVAPKDYPLTARSFERDNGEYMEFEQMGEVEAQNFMKTKEDQEIRGIMREHVSGIGGMVLDAGCGRGIDSQRYHHTRYVGMDISQPLISIAMKNNPEHNYEVEDLRRIPHENNEFDNVICLSVFEQLHSEDDAILVFKELIRVCNKQLLIGWYAQPREITKSEINIVKADDVNRKVFQNIYSNKRFNEVITKVGAKLEVINIDETWVLWKINLEGINKEAKK